MVVRFLTFSIIHNRKGVGSDKIRVQNLIKYWDEAELYRYGENMDVMIFQKVYVTYDYKYPINLKKIKILDVCDPDWQATPDIYIKETIDAMDAVVTPTENLRKLIQQMTDTPVRVIKDRFDLSEFPKPKVHKGETKRAVWFGYAHNSGLMNYVVPSLEQRGISLTIISDNDPHLYKFANDSMAYEAKYTFVKYTQETIYQELQKADVCIMPKGSRPQDRYKSENKTVIAQLCGLPVVQDADQLEAMKTADARNQSIKSVYTKLQRDYDCHESIREYKELISELQNRST